MLHVVDHSVTLSIKFTGNHFYTWVVRGAKTGLKHGPLDPNSSTLNTKPPHLHKDGSVLLIVINI